MPAPVPQQPGIGRLETESDLSRFIRQQMRSAGAVDLNAVQGLPPRLKDLSDRIDAIGTGGSDANYVHTQASAASTWTVNHNLGKFVSVQVVDSSNRQVEADVSWSSLNSLTLNFSSAFSGKAYVN